MKTIKTLDDVNAALREIGVLENELARIDGDANERILAVKAEAEKSGDPLRAQIESLSEKVLDFAMKNKDEIFEEKKSVNLTFGDVGYRESVSLITSPKTCGLLKKLGLDSYIRVKTVEEPRKDLMKEMDDTSLARVDAVKKVENKFYLKTNQEAVNKDLLKKAG